MSSHNKEATNLSILHVKGMQAVTPYGYGAYLIPYPFSEGGKIPDISVSALGWKGLSRKTRETRYSCAVTGEAMQKAGWLDSGEGTTDVSEAALIVSTNESHLGPIAALHEDAKQYGAESTNPALFPDTVLNVVAGHLSVYFGIRGENVTLCGPDSHFQALQKASDLLDQGVERVICCMLSFLPPAMFREHIDDPPDREFVIALALERYPANGRPGITIHLETFGEGESVPAGPLAPTRELPMWVAVICEQLKRQQYRYSRLIVDGAWKDYHGIYMMNAYG